MIIVKLIKHVNIKALPTILYLTKSRLFMQDEECRGEQLNNLYRSTSQYYPLLRLRKHIHNLC